MSDFIHLHNHTHFSLQDAACTTATLIDAAKANNMHAVALTDHGVLYGIPEFYRKATDKGIKPIVGMEAYIVTEGSRFDKQRIEVGANRKKKAYEHLILIAKNLTGYHNLCKLSSIGFLEGFYYRPRIDLEVLRKHSEGLICSSACLGGVVSVHLVNNDYDKARQVAKIYKDLFGDDFYLEMQDHGLKDDAAILEGMPKLAKELNIKLLATNDCHYVKKEDSIAHNIMLLFADKTGEVDYHKLRYGTDQIYFKSSEEMIQLFGKYPGAIENTLEVAEKVDLKFEDKHYHFPQFPIPPESKAKDLDGYFEELAEIGLSKRYKEITPEIKERYDFEIKTIKDMGFAGYFLVVQDFINAAKARKIPVGPGRGSAAGSIVAYALGITNIDPLPYNLLFERFLNPARKSMPDIDVDFADDQRGDVIEYVKQKYGSDCVAQIVTFSRLASKQVLRDVARVLKIPIPTVNKITKFIPSKFGKVATIEESLKDVAELKWVNSSTDPQIKELIKYAKVLEGMNRNTSKHAAGVVIAPGVVSNYVPLSSVSGQEDIVTQFNMKELEEAGLLKMDFLGLRTLTIIRDAVSLIKKNYGKEIDIDAIPTDDKKTFQLFWRGQTTGIFQFESAPMREYLKKLKPTSISDLSAMNALYRPGPMEFIDDFIDRKFGRKEMEYLHPTLEPILKETYGVIVYQEQVIQIANRVGGMSLAEADLLRRAMGKKDLAAMKKQKDKFVEGAMKNGIAEKTAIAIFDAIDKFANYGFNKSHAVAYSYVAYQTAYLKAHYAPEFLAANLTNEFGNKDKVTVLLEECRKLHIDVLPPNINNPTTFFDVEKGKIRFGLSAIKNVGVGAVEELINQRIELGRNFTSLFDLTSNTDTRTINKRTLEGLILAGGLDSVDRNRRKLFDSVEIALNYGSRFRQMKAESANSLFGADSDAMTMPEPQLPDIEDWTESERLAKEREVVGFYVTGHPMHKYELEYRSFANIHLGEIDEDTVFPQLVRSCGVITDFRTKIDSKGKTMAFFTIDDLSGSCECLMFGSAYEKSGQHLAAEKAVLVVGKPESSGDAVKLQIEEVFPIEECREKFAKYFKVVIDKERHSVETLQALQKIAEKHKGTIPTVLEVINPDSLSDVYMLKTMRVKLTNALFKDVTKLLGEDSIFLLAK